MSYCHDCKERDAKIEELQEELNQMTEELEATDQAFMEYKKKFTEGMLEKDIQELNTVLVPDLPAGYKERMDNAVLKLIPESDRIFEICREFDCDRTVLSGNGYAVTIRKVSTDNNA